MAAIWRVGHPWEGSGSTLLIGEAPTPRDRRDLERLGVTDVIDVTRKGRTKWLGGKSAACRRPSRLHCPMQNHVKAQHPAVVRCLAIAIRWGVDALAYPSNALLVHCNSGEHRSPSLAYGIMRAGGWSKSQAMRALSHIPDADPRYIADVEIALRLAARAGA
jgi:hypothetical protein